MKRRTFCAVMAVLLAASGLLAGCSKSDKEAAPTKRAATATTQASKQHDEGLGPIKVERDARIEAVKAKYGGPQLVEVTGVTNSEWLADGHSYTAAWLHVQGEHPQDILVWVRTELIGHKYLKHWYCAQPSKGCDPAIGFTYEVDYPGHPYDGEVASIKKEYPEIKD